jgi:hypothetical protein
MWQFKFLFDFIAYAMSANGRFFFLQGLEKELPWEGTFRMVMSRFSRRLSSIVVMSAITQARVGTHDFLRASFPV